MNLVRLLHRFLVRQTMPTFAVNYYERMCDGIGGFYLQPFADEIDAEFGEGACILDVGTGTGHLPVLLAKGNPRHRVTGLDLSSTCIRSAKARATQANVSGRVEFLRGDLAEVRGRFDLVVSTCSLHHWRYPVRMLRVMVGLLNAGGKIWLLDDSGDVSAEVRGQWVRKVEASFDAGIPFRTVFGFESRHLAYTEAEIRDLCRTAGLEVNDFRIKDVFFTAKCAPAG
jgi:SAM-dependent methyltransferase